MLSLNMSASSKNPLQRMQEQLESVAFLDGFYLVIVGR